MKYKIFHGEPAKLSDRRFVPLERVLLLPETVIITRCLNIHIFNPTLANALHLTSSFTDMNETIVTKSQWEVFERDDL